MEGKSLTGSLMKSPKGIVQIIQSSLSDNNRTLDMFDRNGFVAEIAESEKFFFEEIVLINAYKI